MKLHIVSEGTGNTTKVFTESGEDISRYVRSIKIEINAHDAAIATVEMVNLSVDVNASGKFISPNTAWSRLVEGWAKFARRVCSYFKSESPS